MPTDERTVCANCGQQIATGATGTIYLTEQIQMCDDSNRQGGKEKSVPQIEVTPEMIEAGVDRLRDLMKADVGSAYMVAEVYLAMCSAR